MNDEWIENSVALVIGQFESWKACIEQSFQESDDFQSLCEDYAVCAQALEKWEASNAALADQRRQEYSELLAELGQEIQDWLEHEYGTDRSRIETATGGSNPS
jgi:hypothetical protein